MCARDKVNGTPVPLCLTHHTHVCCLFRVELGGKNIWSSQGRQHNPPRNRRWTYYICHHVLYCGSESGDFEICRHSCRSVHGGNDCHNSFRNPVDGSVCQSSVRHCAIYGRERVHCVHCGARFGVFLAG